MLLTVFLVLLNFPSVVSNISFAQDVVSPQAPTVSEEQDYAFAYGLYRDSLFQLAGQQFESFVLKYPSSFKLQEASFLGIECAFRSSQYPIAIEKYHAFIKQFPTSRYLPEVYLKIGQSYIHQKNIREAIASLKIVLEKFGDSEKAGEAAYWIGEAYLKNDDTPNAIKYYTLAYENFPKNKLCDYALYSIAWTYQKKTEYSRAIEWYEKLISEFPHSTLTPGAYVQIGECYYHAKEYRRALEALEKSRTSIHDEEELGNAEYLIAESYYKLGDNVKAQHAYEQFLADHPRHKLAQEVSYFLGWTFFHQKNYNKSLEVFQKLADRPDDLGHASLYRISVIERLMNKPDRSLLTLNEVLKREPAGEWSDNALFDLGMTFYTENNFIKAKPYFQKLVTDFPQSDVLADGCRMLGECYLIENNLPLAQTWFEKAAGMKDAPFDVKVDASFQSAVCLFKLRKFKEASSKLAEFIEQYPQHPKSGEAKFYRGEAEYQLGNFGAAAQFYQESSENFDKTKREEALYGVAWSYYKQGKFKQSIESFERFLVGYPKGKFSFDARLRLGDSYFYQKDYKKAIGIYRAVIRLYPDTAAIDYAYYQLGQSCFKDGNVAEAIHVFDGFMNTLPQSRLADDAQFAKGWINFQRKDYREAIKEFQLLLKKYPKSDLRPRTYYSLGDAYYNMQQYAPAEQSYREVLRQFPKDQYAADAMTGIQYCYAAQGKDVEALGAFDDFVKENPTAPASEEFQLKKGDLLFNKKKYAEAASVYRNFIGQNPRSQLLGLAQYSLAKSYRMNGNIQDAVVAYEKVSTIPGVSDKIIGESFIEEAEIYNSQGKFDDAIRILKQLQGKVNDPEIIAKAKVKTGQSYQLAGNTPNASALFAEVLKEYGSSPIADEARVAQAKIFFQAGKYDEAKTLAEHVATSRKDDLGAEAQYIVGASLAGKKQWKEVVTALLRVKYIFPSYERWIARSYLGLGDAYEQLKDSKRARESYEAVLRYKTDSSVVAETQRRLKLLERQ